MAYQKMINFLENIPNKPPKCGTKNWVGIIDDARGTYSTNSQIKFKTAMLKTSLCDYIDTYILVKENLTTNGAGADDPAKN